MAESESVDSRPKCSWPVTTKKESCEVTEACKSEVDVFKVTGSGRHTGRTRESDICGKHLGGVWGDWNVRTAEKYPAR